MDQAKADKLSAEAERCPFASQSEVDGLLSCWIFAAVLSAMSHFLGASISVLGGYIDHASPTHYGEMSLFGFAFMWFGLSSLAISCCACAYLISYSSYYGFEDKLVAWIWKQEQPTA